KLRAKLDSLSSKVGELGSKPLNPLPGWLRDEAAEASFGLTAREKWPHILRRLKGLPSEINEASVGLQKLDSKLRTNLAKVQELSQWVRSAEKVSDIETRQKMIDYLLNIVDKELTEINEAYNYCRPSEWTQDFGWQGAIAQIDSAIAKVDRALASYDMEKAAVVYDDENPLKPLFIGPDDSPYTWVWGWYLGALYDVINALTVIRGRQHLAAFKLAIVENLLDYVQAG